MNGQQSPLELGSPAFLSVLFGGGSFSVSCPRIYTVFLLLAWRFSYSSFICGLHVSQHFIFFKVLNSENKETWVMSLAAPTQFCDLSGPQFLY